MNVYGIGRAMVDYYVEGRIDDGVMEAVFRQLPDRLLPSKMGIPIHAEGDALSFVLESIGTFPQFRLVRETGGTCLNILKTISLLSPGSRCLFSGTVGSDGIVGTVPKDTATPATIEPDSTFLRRQLDDYGIRSRLRHQEGHTGRCLVLAGCAGSSRLGLPQQSWLALASPAVAAEIQPGQVDCGWLAGCDWLVAEGMELDSDWFCRLLAQAGTRLVLACGTPFGAARTAAFLKDLGRPQGLVLVLANDNEARVLEREGIDIRETSRRGFLFVITHGCGGSSCYLSGERLSVPAAPVGRERTVDATGAGDVFAGVFLAALPVAGGIPGPQEIVAAMEYASTAAAQILQVPLCSVSALHPWLGRRQDGQNAVPPMF